jgi:hypothetical protein
MLDGMVLDAPLASAEADAFIRQRASRAASCSAVPVTQTTDTRTYIPRAHTVSQIFGAAFCRAEPGSIDDDTGGSGTR